MSKRKTRPEEIAFLRIVSESSFNFLRKKDRETFALMLEKLAKKLRIRKKNLRPWVDAMYATHKRISMETKKRNNKPRKPHKASKKTRPKIRIKLK